MKLSELIGKLRVIIPVGPFLDKILEEVEKCQADMSTTLKEAEKNYIKACYATDHALSDWSYWATRGTEIFWEVIVNLLRTAKKTGPDNLPDIAFPDIKNHFVMDAQFYLSEWGKDIVKTAGLKPVERLAFKKKEGCKCVNCSFYK